MKQVSFFILAFAITIFASQYDFRLFTYEYGADSVVYVDSNNVFGYKFIYHREPMKIAEIRIFTNQTDTNNYYFDASNNLIYYTSSSAYSFVSYDSGALYKICSSKDSLKGMQCNDQISLINYVNNKISRISSYPDSSTRYFSYNAQNDLSVINSIFSRGTINIIDSFSYDYANERVTDKTYSNGILIYSTDYQYSNGKLIEMDFLNGNTILRKGTFYYSPSSVSHLRSSYNSMVTSKKGRYFLVNGQLVDNRNINKTRRSQIMIKLP
jgi:hypothetical protein